jgi:hypothetical protein
MPKNEIDPEDPHALIGVAVPVDDLEAARDALARGLVEEFVRFGYDVEAVLALFKTPFYAGAHQVLRLRGEAYVRALAEEAVLRYRPRVQREPQQWTEAPTLP